MLCLIAPILCFYVLLFIFNSRQNINMISEQVGWQQKREFLLINSLCITYCNEYFVGILYVLFIVINTGLCFEYHHMGRIVPSMRGWRLSVLVRNICRFLQRSQFLGTNSFFSRRILFWVLKDVLRILGGFKRFSWIKLLDNAVKWLCSGKVLEVELQKKFISWVSDVVVSN